MDNDLVLVPSPDQAQHSSMALFTEHTRRTLLLENKLTEEEFKRLGLPWADLEEIARRHSERTRELESVANFISATLQRAPSQLVHSTRVRIKDPLHLVSKIIRKRKDYPDRVFTPDNYQDQVTDLIGVRVLHLTRERWLPIDQFIRKTWDLKEGESVVAHLREGDPPEWEEMYEKNNCVIDKTKPYRSVHYQITVAPTKVVHQAEIQVRTLFDEGWSELDHELRYPVGTEDPTVLRWLRLLNLLSGAADELAALLMYFIESQSMQTKEREQLSNQAQTLEAKMNDLLKEKDIDAAKLAELRSTNDQLRAANKKIRDIEGVKTFVDWLTGPHPLLEVLQQQQEATAGALSDILDRTNTATLTAAIDSQIKVMSDAQQNLVRALPTLPQNVVNPSKTPRVKARQLSTTTQNETSENAPDTKGKGVEADDVSVREQK